MFGPFTVVIALVLFASTALANENSTGTNEFETVLKGAPTANGYYEEIYGQYLEIPYDPTEVTVKKYVYPQKEILIIKARDSGEVLKEVSISEDTSMKNANDVGLMAEDFLLLDSTTNHNGLDVTLNARLVIYSSGSFRQINSVNEAWWTTGGGPHTLAASNVDWLPSAAGDYPTSSVTITGQTTIEIEISADAQAGYETAGFTVTAGVSGTLYARKTVNDTIAYSI